MKRGNVRYREFRSCSMFSEYGSSMDDPSESGANIESTSSALKLCRSASAVFRSPFDMSDVEIGEEEGGESFVLSPSNSLISV